MVTNEIASVTDGGTVVDSGADLLSNAISDYLANLDVRDSTKSQYRRNLKQFAAWMGATGRSFQSLTHADILAYSAYLQAPSKGSDTPKLSPRTIGAYLVSVRGLFGYLSAAYGVRDLGKGVKNPRKTKGFIKQHLTPEQVTALLDYYSERGRVRDYAIVSLLVRCGLRTIEVTRLNVGSITSRAGRKVLSVWGKGHSTADSYVLLSEKAEEAIRNYIATRSNPLQGEPLFVSKSNRNGGGRLTTRTIRNIVEEGLTAVGLTGHEYSAHSLRHTTAVSLIYSGAQLEDVRDVLRHQSVKTSEIYVESIREDKRLSRAAETALDRLF